MNTAKRTIELKGEQFNKGVAKKKPLVDLSYLNDVSGGNGSFINAMLQAFKDESTIFLRDMERYIERCDFLSMAKSAHKMKPAGAYLGVNTLTALMNNLEQAAASTQQKDTTTLFGEVKKLIKKIVNEIDGYVTEH